MPRRRAGTGGGVRLTRAASGADAAATFGGAARGRGGRLRRALAGTDEGARRLVALAASLVVIWIVFDIATGGLFLTPRNFYNLAVQSSAVAVLTVGMVMVIITRNIDLSVGSILGFTGMIIALLQIEVFPAGAAWNWPATVALGLLAGTLIGLWHGLLVAYVGIPSFVVTLAGLLIFRGATFEVADGRTLSPFQDGYRIFGGGAEGSLGEVASWVGVALCILAAVIIAARHGRREGGRWRVRDGASVAAALAGAGAAVFAVAMFNAYEVPRTDVGHGIPSPLLILAVVAAIAAVAMRGTPFGRHVRAVGQDAEAARLVGVPTRRVVLTVFAAMGALAAVGAIITTARLNAGTTNLGTLLELNVIAAAVIGGASLSGGRGSIIGGVLGAFVIQSLDTGMVLLGVSSSMRQILIGLVLIAAVWLDRIAARGR